MLSQEHQLTRKVAREFAEKLVEQVARKMDRENYYPREVVREAGKLGILTPTVPPTYGGGGGDLRSTVVILEEVGRVSGGFSLLMEACGTLFSHTLLTFGTEQQKEEVLARVAGGEAVGAFALSEPCCGSDAAAIETRAEKVGGEWQISGIKTWITSGLYADYYLVFARTGAREERHKTITAFLVKRNNCIETTPIEVMGMRGTGTAEVKFNQCPALGLVGEINRGWDVVMEALNVGRAAISGVALGIVVGVFEEVLGWARRRVLFGQRLVDFQNTQFELAEMYAAIETIRILTYYAAYLYDLGSRDEFITTAHIAKLQSARLAVDVTRRAVQILGGYGYSKESKAETSYRDAKLLEIGEGTNEVMKHVLYRLLSKKLLTL
ncbi:MAG: acyl-CoA dehydrogenase family protein [Pyrobaculum sp.]